MAVPTRHLPGLAGHDTTRRVPRELDRVGRVAPGAAARGLRAPRATAARGRALGARAWRPHLVARSGAATPPKPGVAAGHRTIAGVAHTAAPRGARFARQP